SVCASVGFDTSSESVPYIAGWGAGGAAAAVEQFAALVDRLAAAIEAAIEGSVEPRSERGKSRTDSMFALLPNPSLHRTRSTFWPILATVQKRTCTNMSSRSAGGCAVGHWSKPAWRRRSIGGPTVARPPYLTPPAVIREVRNWYPTHVAHPAPR